MATILFPPVYTSALQSDGTFDPSWRSWFESLQAQINSSTGDIASLTARVVALESAVTTIQGQITSINSSIATINTSITSINSSITSINSSITSINNSITAINSSISNTIGTGSYALTTVSTFTPALTFGGNNVGMTYTSRSGNYTRIGRMCWFVVSIVLSAKGSSTGGASVTGLPFTASTGSLVQVTFSANVSTTPPCYFGQVLGGTITASLNLQGATSTAGLSDTFFNNNTSLLMAGCYLTT